MLTRDIADSLAGRLSGIRRDFHMHPELSFKEFETSRKIAEILSEAGIEIVNHGLSTGVVGLLRTGKPGPTIALRGDIDALPVEEQNDVEYRSRVPGVMHACGHDIHITAVLGAALILSRMKDQLTGNVKFLFQPAEEINAGARTMLEAGVMENPHVEAIFGVHNQPDIPAGMVGVKAGALMAAVDTIGISVSGVGGHGALPHRTVDPIVAGAAIVLNLQTAVSRNTSPLEPAVVSIGTFQAGTANNVIPDRVQMTGTVRTFNPELRKAMPSTLSRIVESTAQALGATAQLSYRRDLPAVINSKEYAEIATGAVLAVCGEGKVVDPVPSMGGEDFALFLEKAPGCFLWLGVGNRERGIVNQWHHPRFDADESSLPVGAAVLAQCVIDANKYLKK
ncbi:MAG: M20 metallopeptidase family protein [Bacillota bacterium]